MKAILMSMCAIIMSALIYVGILYISRPSSKGAEKGTSSAAVVSESESESVSEKMSDEDIDDGEEDDKDADNTDENGEDADEMKKSVKMVDMFHTYSDSKTGAEDVWYVRYMVRN